VDNVPDEQQPNVIIRDFKRKSPDLSVSNRPRPAWPDPVHRSTCCEGSGLVGRFVVAVRCQLAAMEFPRFR